MRCVVGLCVAAWIGLLARGQEPSSQLFRPEGHGVRTGWLFPDDDARRITAIGDVTTPHIEWAKPRDAGSLRVLAIAARTDGRWPVELAERFDFDVSTVLTYDTGRLGAPPDGNDYGQTAPDVEARILQALDAPFDVIVSGVPPPVLGEKVSGRIVKCVREGIGYVGPVEGLDLSNWRRDPEAEGDTVRAAVPVAGLRTLAKASLDAIVRIWQGPLGRVADPSAYPRDTAKPAPERLQYAWLPSMEQEAWCSLMGRLTLWAATGLHAGTAPVIQWPKSGEPLQRADLPRKLKVEWGGAASLSVSIWDADGQLRHTEGKAGGAGKAVVPKLPAGRYFIGVQRKTENGVADWSFDTFEVVAPVQVSSVELDSPYKRTDEKVRATAHLSGPPPRGAMLEFEVLDNFGRCVATEKVAAAREAAFEADLTESLHLYNYVNVRLLDRAGEELSENRTAFYLARPPLATDDISVMVWEGGAQFDPVSRGRMRRFAELGVDAALQGTLNGDMDTHRCEACAMANVHPVLYVTAVRPPTVTDAGLRVPCITEPGSVASLKTTLTKQAETFRRYAPLAYSLGDDQQYLRPGQDACWSPSCCALFAAWTKAKYGTVEKVNNAWGTTYNDFAQVEPIKEADALAAARRASQPSFGPLCHWVDHQLFLDTMLANWHRDIADTVEATDPGAVCWYDCTMEGWLRPGSAFDFWQIATKSRFCVQYPNPLVHDIYQSATPPGAFHGMWYGGYGLYTYPPYYDDDLLPWWNVFRGINLHGLFYGGDSPPYFSEALLGSDLGCMPGVQKAMDSLGELRGGIAKLLFNATRMTDGIAVVYSPPSVHLTALFEEGLPRAPEWEGQATGGPSYLYVQCWEGLTALLRDVGFDFDVVPSSYIEDGRILDKGYRVLVMPLNLRLSDAEGETVRRFVRGGGVLLTDAFFGRFDAAARPGNSCADVQGFSVGGSIVRPNLERQAAKTKDGAALGELVVEKGVTVGTATAYGETARGVPILLVNKYGEGLAVCLNALARDYQIARTSGTEMPLRDAVAGILRERAGIERPVACDVGIRGKFHGVQASEIRRYRLGDATYVGILRHDKERPDDVIYLADLRPKPVRITFGEKATHVYDVRGRTYRGLTNTVEDVLYAGHAELFALLPYEVRDVELSSTQSAGALTITGRIVPDGPGIVPTTHVIHVEVKDPAGRAHREFTRNVLAEAGRFSERVFLGYNADPGPWTVLIRDAATGTERELVVRVKPG